MFCFNRIIAAWKEYKLQISVLSIVLDACYSALAQTTLYQHLFDTLIDVISNAKKRITI